MRTALAPEWLVDGTGAPPLEGHALLIEDDRIQAVVPLGQLAHDQAVERLPGVTLLPGLINCHVHLSLPGDNTPYLPWFDGQSDVALGLRAAHNAHTALRAGITTVRDCGARHATVLDVRQAQHDGLVSCARIVSCGWPLTITGGHMRPFGGEADGKEGVRVMVRRIVSAGTDFLKVAGSGGGTPGSLPAYPSFSVPEVRTIIYTGRSLGRKVTMHCTATAAIANALEAGVDSIEHGYFTAPGNGFAFEKRFAGGLAEAEISVTPTLQVARDMLEVLPPGPERDDWQARRETQHETVRRLRDYGVVLTAGSDAGWRATSFDTLWRELEELVTSGLAPIEAIHAATGRASQLIELQDEIGTLEPGKRADLLLVHGNAAQNVACLANVRAVYQKGKPVDLAMTPV
jgi:imidazolonepropionase-like amidohydrolase